MNGHMAEKSKVNNCLFTKFLSWRVFVLRNGSEEPDADFDLTESSLWGQVRMSQKFWTR